MDIVIRDVATGLLNISNTQILTKGEIFNNLEQTQIKIGKDAGLTQATNSIIINASGSVLNNSQSGSIVVKPVRETAVSGHILTYNDTTGEIGKATLNNVSDAVGGNSYPITITNVELSDTFIVTTDNASGDIQVFANLARPPTTGGGLIENPKFITETAIETSVNWDGDGWALSASSVYSSQGTTVGGFDKGTTSWTSFGGYSTSTGTAINNAQSWLQIQYPRAVSISQYSLSWSSAFGVPPKAWDLQGSLDNVSFETVHSGTKTDWQNGLVYSFDVAGSSSFRYWRILVYSTNNTFQSSGGTGNNCASILEFRIFTSTVSLLSRIYSVYNLDYARFKIILTDNIGLPLSGYTNNDEWLFNLMITKNGKIATTGLYKFVRNNLSVILTKIT